MTLKVPFNLLSNYFLRVRLPPKVGIRIPFFHDFAHSPFLSRSLSVSLSDRVQRKPQQLSLSSSVPYENITRESSYDNSVCETVSERIPECWTFFCLQYYRDKQTPTGPPYSPLILPPHAHHYWTLDTLESRDPAWGKLLFNLIVSPVPLAIFPRGLSEVLQSINFLK